MKSKRNERCDYASGTNSRRNRTLKNTNKAVFHLIYWTTLCIFANILQALDYISVGC